MKMFIDAFRGIKIALQTEKNLKIHFCLMIIVLVLAFIFHLNMLEWCLLFLAIGLVFSAELLNTAIEKMVDYFSLEKNLQARNIKDIAAGAVLINAIIAFCIGAFIFLPKFYQVLKNYF